MKSTCYNQNKSTIKAIIILTTLTIAVLIPQYLSRMNFNNLYWFYNSFSTYFGDLWYCWNNYLSKGFNYPVEYPAGMQFIFESIAKLPNIQSNYDYYMMMISSIIAIAGVFCSLFLYASGAKLHRIICGWIFAPSFIFYPLYNVDLIPILSIILSYYLQQKRRPQLAILCLAIGTAIKVFPIFLLPVFLLENHGKQRLKLIIIFILIWLACNINFMITDWGRWIYPYLWQIQENFAKTNHDGSWTWLIYVMFEHFGIGNWSGKVSLLLFTLSYGYLIHKNQHWTLARKLSCVMILFLLTDRIYSPQYNLYLLPCLVLLDYKVNWRYFYLLEIPNFCQGFFLFSVKNHPWMLQSIITIKYLAMFLLLKELINTPQINSNIIK